MRCDWLDTPGMVGSTFRGRNRSGLAHWSTVARVVVADRPREFTFVTLHRGREATRWRYLLECAGEHTVVDESFETISTPLLIGLAERFLIRHRQSQIEAGMAQTLRALKVTAEQHCHARPDA